MQRAVGRVETLQRTGHAVDVGFSVILRDDGLEQLVLRRDGMLGPFRFEIELSARGIVRQRRVETPVESRRRDQPHAQQALTAPAVDPLAQQTRDRPMREGQVAEREREPLGRGGA